MNGALLDTLFACENWAACRALKECGTLTQAHFEQPLGLGHGSLEHTQALDMLRLLGNEQSLEWHPFEWDEAGRAGEV